MAEPKNERLVWIDCEMTGLDPTRDELVEVAAIVTDGNLVELDAGISLVIRPMDITILHMMHDTGEVFVLGLVRCQPCSTSVVFSQCCVLPHSQLEVNSSYCCDPVTQRAWLPAGCQGWTM